MFLRFIHSVKRTTKLHIIYNIRNISLKKNAFPAVFFVHFGHFVMILCCNWVHKRRKSRYKLRLLMKYFLTCEKSHHNTLRRATRRAALSNVARLV